MLNDIHIDVMDYITPGHCSDNDFRYASVGDSSVFIIDGFKL